MLDSPPFYLIVAFCATHSQLSATNSLIVEDLKTFPFSCFLLLSLAHICSLLRTRRTNTLDKSEKRGLRTEIFAKSLAYMFTTSFLKDNTAKVLLKDRYKEVLIVKVELFRGLNVRLHNT